MAEKFEEFSKHLATKHSRRGLFRFMGAGFLGAIGAAFAVTGADAHWYGRRRLYLNRTNPHK